MVMTVNPDTQGNRYDKVRAEAEAKGQVVMFTVRESDRFNEWAPSRERARFTDEEDARRAVEVIGSNAWVGCEIVESSFDDWYARNYQAVTTTRHVPRRG